MWIHHLNQAYWTSHFQRKSQLCYVVSSRSFSSNNRSDVILVNKSQQRFSFVVAAKQKLLPGIKLCEVRQTLIRKKMIFIFHLFKNKINRASKKVQENFTLNKTYCMFISLEIALKNKSQNGYYKYNLVRKLTIQKSVTIFFQIV